MASTSFTFRPTRQSIISTPWEKTFHPFLIRRAAVRYHEVAQYSDYVKPILYHDILGPRMRWWVVDHMHTRVMSDFTMEQTLAGLYTVLGHNPDEQPSLDQLSDRGLSPEYVYRETKRCVDGVDGQAKVYSGIGLDVPWHLTNGMAPFPSDPEVIYASGMRAIEAGASELIASREYDEMRMPRQLPSHAPVGSARPTSIIGLPTLQMLHRHLVQGLARDTQASGLRHEFASRTRGERSLGVGSHQL